MPAQGRGQEPQSPKLLPCGVWVERRWAPRRGFALPGEAAGGPRLQPSRAGESRQAPGVTGSTGRAASKPAARAPWSHSAIKRPPGERPRRAQERGPGLPAPTGSEGGSGARPGPAKLSLQARRQEPADGHQLSRRTTQPRAGQEPTALEDAQGLLLQSQTHPLLQQLAPS